MIEIVPEKEDNNTRASLELLYHVSREIATAADLSTLIQRVLFLSMRSIGAISGTIIVVDDSGSPVASAIIRDTHVLDYSTDQLRETLDRGLAGWVVRNRQAVLIPDTSKDKRWLRRPDDAEDATGPKSAVIAPFLARERLAGVITLVHPEPHFFNLDHLALVQAIADQAAIGVLNARLHTDSLHQARVMTALAESATAITGSLHLSEVLQRILEQISQALRVEAVSLALIDSQKQTLEYLASTSPKKHSVVGKTIRLGQGVAGWVAEHHQGVIVPHAYEDPRFFPGIDQDTGFRTKAIACAPIRSHGEVIGILEAINPVSGRFDSDALSVLMGIGSLAGTTIRHAQLFEDLQAAHKRYRDLFEDDINSIIITNWDGQIIEANRQTAILSKYDKEKLPGLSISAIHKNDANILGQDFSQLSEGEALSYESVLHTRTGVEIPIMVYVHPVNIEGKSYLQWILQDITERKELDQLREDLLSMIYHDLRSPLANVVSSLDVLATMLTLEDDPALKSLFDIAVRSTERIERLTNSMLDINLLEAGRSVVNIRPNNTRKIILESMEIIRPVAENKRQKIDLQIPEDIPPVMVNGDMVRRVMINLLENATKFTPPDGLIQVGALEDQCWVQVWVEDTGPGIPAERMKSIFDKYTRLHGKGGPAGFGLGLAYCRLAIEGHGGKIWVENVEDGGARFAFTLPISDTTEGIDE